MNDEYFLLYLAIFLLIIYTIYKTEEHFKNDVYIKKEFISCEGCKVWNNKDARSEFEYLCKKKFPGNTTEFTGNWKRKNGKVFGECALKVKKNKSMFSTNNLNILSNDDAKQFCPNFCVNQIHSDPYKLNGKYTGKWNDDKYYKINCECEHEELF